MSSLLAIETSVPEASVALWRDGRWLFEEEFASDRNHNSVLFGPLAAALEALGGEELDAVIVGTGPGSYSGTRIGIAAAQGVAVARGCCAAGVGSFAATPVARRWGGGDVPRPMAVGDARRGLFFVSRITESGEAGEAELMPAEEFARVLGQWPGGDLFTFDDPERLGLPSGLAGRVRRVRPEARLLVDVWLGLGEGRRRELAAQLLSPRYLRAPFTSKAKPGHPLLRRA